MEPTVYDIAHIIAKYLEQKPLTANETFIFEKWLKKEDNRRLLESFRDGKLAQKDIELIRNIDTTQGWSRFQAKKRHQKLILVRRSMGYAAAIILLLLSGVWFFAGQNNKQSERKQVRNLIHNDVAPGKVRAEIVLEDGRKMDVAVYTDELRKQKNKQIIGGNGKLIYNGGLEKSSLPAFNTLIVPKGGMYQVTLSDQTKVWLNASSKLRYPVQFDNNERTVYLEGEAYFDVAADASRPFNVLVGDTKLHVLGTEFNINAYDYVSATLVSGSVKIASNTDERLLMPGQMATIHNGISLHKANLQKVLAWKNGEFYFRKDNIHEIMDELARWYNVNVVFIDDAPERKYNGSISRNVDLSNVLEMLSYVSGAQFEVIGKKVMVRF